MGEEKRARYVIFNEQYINRLAAAAGSARAEERLKAVLALQKLPGGISMPLLNKMINDSSPWVRHHARRAQRLVQKKTNPGVVKYSRQQNTSAVIKEEPGRIKILLEKQPFIFPHLLIDSGKGMVRVNDKPVRLTAAEFRLLLTLAENQGCYVSKDRLYALAVDDGAAVGNDTALKTHIKRIRQKLGDDGRNQKYIQCFKRYGYRLREDIDVKISSRD